MGRGGRKKTHPFRGVGFSYLPFLCPDRNAFARPNRRRLAPESLTRERFRFRWIKDLFFNVASVLRFFSQDGPYLLIGQRHQIPSLELQDGCSGPVG